MSDDEKFEDRAESKDHRLFEGNFLDLREIFISPDASEKDVEEDQGFEYVREKRCNGQVVACLPYREKRTHTAAVFDTVEFLLRREIVPPWGTQSQLCSITGGYEEELGEPVETMREEMIEEAGYDLPVESFISLGTVRSVKSADTLYHLFTVDLTDVDRDYEDPKGDGSLLEEYGSVEWSESIAGVNDPQVYVMWYRLIHDRL